MSVGRYLDASTAHLTAAEGHRLPDGGDHADVEAHEYGWWVWVPTTVDQDDQHEQAFRAAFPCLAVLMDRARAHGCAYLRLDAGGATLDGLPTFQW